MSHFYSFYDEGLHKFARHLLNINKIHSNLAYCCSFSVLFKYLEDEQLLYNTYLYCSLWHDG